MLNIVTNKFFAEFGTDKLIREKYFPDWLFKGIMVEVGAGTPQFLSMSQHFRLNGWRCICVEPNPSYVEMHRRRGHEVYPIACAGFDKDDQDFEVVQQPGESDPTQIGEESFSALKVKESYVAKHPEFSRCAIRKIKVNVRKLNTLLDSLSITRVDLLSIDVEGWELEVLKGFSLEKFKPQVVVLENYLETDEYERYMNARGYALRYMLEYNYIFTPSP